MFYFSLSVPPCQRTFAPLLIVRRVDRRGPRAYSVDNGGEKWGQVGSLVDN